MRTSRVHIESPCHESWDAMEGDAQRRFCGVCQKDVHNLSAMRLDDARDLLERSAGDRLCVRYTAERDGAVRLRDLVPSSRLTRGLVRAAFAASMLAACMPEQPAPIAAIGDAVIDSLDPAPGPTGSRCDFAPTPFVTFHLPPGHALCGLSTEVPAIAPPAAADVSLPPALSAPLPLPPPPLFDPVVAPPRHANPAFSPHGAGQGFAPPPPSRGFTSRPSPWPGVTPDPAPEHVRMGDYAPPPPHPGFAPPPPPHPGFAPPPPPVDRPTMGSISLPERETMGRIAPSR